MKRRNCFALWRHSALVGVSDWITPEGLGVTLFESCTLQKCYATTWIAITPQGCPHHEYCQLKWADSMIIGVKPFFLFIKKKKKNCFNALTALLGTCLWNAWWTAGFRTKNWKTSKPLTLRKSKQKKFMINKPHEYQIVKTQSLI